MSGTSNDLTNQMIMDSDGDLWYFTEDTVLIYGVEVQDWYKPQPTIDNPGVHPAETYKYLVENYGPLKVVPDPRSL